MRSLLARSLVAALLCSPPAHGQATDCPTSASPDQAQAQNTNPTALDTELADQPIQIESAGAEVSRSGDASTARGGHRSPGESHPVRGNRELRRRDPRHQGRGRRRIQRPGAARPRRNRHLERRPRRQLQRDRVRIAVPPGTRFGPAAVSFSGGQSDARGRAVHDLPGRQRRLAVQGLVASKSTATSSKAPAATCDSTSRGCRCSTRRTYPFPPGRRASPASCSRRSVRPAATASSSAFPITSTWHRTTTRRSIRHGSAGAGSKLGGNFRYLTEQSRGRIDGRFLPIRPEGGPRSRLRQAACT